MSKKFKTEICDEKMTFDECELAILRHAVDETNEIQGCKMCIKFSMSSQLWIYLEMSDELRQFIVASSEVSTQPKYNYIDLLDKLD